MLFLFLILIKGSEYVILQEYLEITPSSKNLRYYIDKGYDARMREPILIKNEDVLNGSKIEETRKCDKCGVEFTRTRRAIIDTFRSYNKDLCVNCSKIERTEKTKKTNLEKYGVEFPMQSKKIKQKAIETSLKNYGCEYTFQNIEVQKKAKNSIINKYGSCSEFASNSEVVQKRKNTNLERYGCENVFQSDEIKNKIRNTITANYGVDNISKSDEIKIKKTETTMRNYGVQHPLQSKEIQQRAINTLCKNNTVPTSSQQIEIFNILRQEYPNYSITLNKPCFNLILDIELIDDNGQKIDIEYDGWYWHKNKLKDRRRDEVLKKKGGYKILRILSGVQIPEVIELKEKIDSLLNTDKEFTVIKLSDWKN